MILAIRRRLRSAMMDAALAGDLPGGIQLYERALAHNAQHADAWYNMGVAWVEAGDFHRAIYCYELAVHFNPHCAEAHNNLGAPSPAAALLNHNRVSSVSIEYAQAWCGVQGLFTGTWATLSTLRSATWLHCRSVPTSRRWEGSTLSQLCCACSAFASMHHSYPLTMCPVRAGFKQPGSDIHGTGEGPGGASDAAGCHPCGPWLCRGALGKKDIAVHHLLILRLHHMTSHVCATAGIQ